MNLTKNTPLLIGIALPIIFIIAISIIIFTPSLFIKPEYNFLYSKSDFDYDYNNRYAYTYEVKDNQLSLQAVPPKKNITYREGPPPLYLYDVKNDTTRQIELSEAQALTVDPGPSSPDGYIVKYNYSHSGIFELFGGGSDESGYVISKGSGSKKLSGLNSIGYRYSQRDVQFIGWVK